LDPAVLDAFIWAAAAGRSVEIDWRGARRVFEQATGVPVPLSTPVRAAL
jgi:hypothetical protein